MPRVSRPLSACPNLFRPRGMLIGHRFKTDATPCLGSLRFVDLATARVLHAHAVDLSRAPVRLFQQRRARLPRTGHRREPCREPVPHAGSGFSASPIAADCKLCLPSEDGDVFVIRPGPKFELPATNPVGEPLMATPALANKAMSVRGQHHLLAVSWSD